MSFFISTLKDVIKNFKTIIMGVILGLLLGEITFMLFYLSGEKLWVIVATALVILGLTFLCVYLIARSTKKL